MVFIQYISQHVEIGPKLIDKKEPLRLAEFDTRYFNSGVRARAFFS